MRPAIIWTWLFSADEFWSRRCLQSSKFELSSFMSWGCFVFIIFLGCITFWEISLSSFHISFFFSYLVSLSSLSKLPILPLYYPWLTIEQELPPREGYNSCPSMAQVDRGWSFPIHPLAVGFHHTCVRIPWMARPFSDNLEHNTIDF